MFLVFWLISIVLSILVFRYWIKKGKFTNYWYFEFGYPYTDGKKHFDYYIKGKDIEGLGSNDKGYIEKGKQHTRLLCFLLSLTPFVNLTSLLVIGIAKNYSEHNLLGKIMG